MPAFPVILRSEATKNLNAKLEVKILRFAQDDNGRGALQIPICENNTVFAFSENKL